MSPISVHSVADWLLPHHGAPRAEVATEGRPQTTPKTIGDYLIERLRHYGVEHAFGIPGDYSITLYRQMRESGLIQPINTVDEQGAGYAAEVYARARGLGLCLTTYAVGGLKVVNNAAEAFAEKSPLVIVSGAPGVRERAKGHLLHHVVRDFGTQARVFEEVTVASTVLEVPEIAFAEIDRVLAAAIRESRPVYIEVPRDMFTAAGEPGHTPHDYKPAPSSQEILQEAVAEAAQLINQAERPVIFADVELERFRLAQPFLDLLESTNIPFVTTILAKSILSEDHPLFLGVYQGALGKDDVRQYVEASDCIVMLGAMLTDISLGLFTAKVDPTRAIYVSVDKLSIVHHVYEHVTLPDFVTALAQAGIRRRDPASLPRPTAREPFEPIGGQAMTATRLFQAVDEMIDGHTAVVVDTGEALLAGADLLLDNDAVFYSSGYYTAVGFSVPAAMGAQLADPSRRPLVVTGDAAFQMTGPELSTIARLDLNPIVVVMNNGGYGSERPLDDGPYVEIRPWDYAKFAEVVQAGRGVTVRTEDDMAAAMEMARSYLDGFVIIDVHLAAGDYTPAFRRFLELFAAGTK